MSVMFKQGQVVQAGGRAVMRDATGTPQESPLSINTSGVTLAVPTGAVAIVLYTAAQNAILAVDSGYANGYMTLVKGVTHRIPCADGQPLYVKAAADTDNLNFYFEIS